jgi:hypothetical protein
MANSFKNLEGRGLGLVEIMPRDWPRATEHSQVTQARIFGVSAEIRPVRPEYSPKSYLLSHCAQSH